MLAKGQRLNHNSHGLGWQIGLRHPLVPEQYLAHLWLDNIAAGTSGDANQFFYNQGQRYGHILDPRTGHPVEKVLSATAFCSTAAEADALATAFYVMGPKNTAEYCQQYDAGFLIVEQGLQNRSTRLHAKGITQNQIVCFGPENKDEGAREIGGLFLFWKTLGKLLVKRTLTTGAMLHITNKFDKLL